MLYEKLTADELKIIEILRSNYCGSDSDYFHGSFVSNKDFLRFWETAKAPMIEAFGDRLIVKKPINSMVEDDELYEKMNKVFWMPEYNRFKDALLAYLEKENEDTWNAWSMRTANGERVSLHDMVDYHLLTIEEWVSNRYDGETCEIKIGAGNVIKVAHGCKVMKVLGRMAKACGTDVAEWFEILRLRQSQVLNEARMNANLCISIHPLDFMTASYNSNDWRSCMCWEDGEYRRGVIEMMNSPMVVCAYLESKSEVLDWYNGLDMPRLEWNSKRWREFFIVRPDMISGIKGYPYWNRTLEDMVINMLTDMFAPVFHTKYAPICEWRTDVPVQDAKYDIDILPDMNCGPAMYNDFYSDNDYHTRFAVGCHGEEESNYYSRSAHEHIPCLKTSVFYSGESECVVCGEPDQDFDGEGEIACCECVEHVFCSKCGDAIYSNSEVYTVNGLTYCQYCYEQLDTCSACGCVCDTDNDENTMKFVISYHDHGEDWRNLGGIGDGHDVLRERPAEGEEEFYIEQELKIFNVCADCAEKIFKDGANECHKAHDWRMEYYSRYTAVPLSRLTDYAIEALGIAKDVEYFKAMHELRAKSA